MTDPKPATAPTHSMLANAIRLLTLDAVEAANSGHPGLPMGMADVATVLWGKFLRFDPATPDWADRDRFVLSAGHGSMLLYATSYLTGYKRMALDELKRFRQLHSLTPGHPEHDIAAGIETTTGPLGQGIATAVGMALAERAMNARFGDDLVDHRTWVIASDGDLMEGVSHEACSLAGHLRLSRLIVLYDDNGISIDGPTSLSFSDDTAARFRSYGWDVQTVDAHDADEIEHALGRAMHSDKPTLIACRSIIGYGSPNRAGTSEAHSNAFGAVELAATREKLEWPHEPFHIPGEILESWRKFGKRGQAAVSEWNKRHQDHRQQAAFDQAIAGTIGRDAEQKLTEYKAKVVADKPKLATRQASGQVLELLLPAVPELVGGSADLTPSNNTRTKNLPAIEAGKFAGRYVHWGVREHGMAAAMNGMALHGGVIPYGGTFLSFADYCRPAIRLSALMKQRVVYVMTHDSIGLGEDGPTHQPVEHIPSLRAMPNLYVFRPADAVETAEAWQLALARTDGPSLLALTRQNVAPARTEAGENLTAKGAYRLAPATGTEKVTLLATGSEVQIAMEARAELEAAGIGTTVVSMPCWELFEQQSEEYRRQVLPQGTVKIGIEAAIRLGWDRWIGPDGLFVGMPGFGESAPYQQLYERFGITTAAVVAAAKARV